MVLPSIWAMDVNTAADAAAWELVVDDGASRGK